MIIFWAHLGGFARGFNVKLTKLQDFFIVFYYMTVMEQT